jgi:acyl carrier protein
VVVVVQDESGFKRLVAYVVFRAGTKPAPPELVGFLKEQLPDYMIPSAFVELTALPLNVNGKVDRRALPAPDGSRPELETDFIAPRTAAEDVVAEIWKRTLGVDRVGVRDNFFELGGHSLLATRVVSRLREVFQVELPLRSLFERPTIEGQVEVMAEIWNDREIVEEIARTMKEIEGVSADEVEELLSGREPQ